MSQYPPQPPMGYPPPQPPYPPAGPMYGGYPPPGGGYPGQFPGHYAPPPQQPLGPMPSSRYLKALAIVLWIESVWFLLSISGTLLMPTVAGAGGPSGGVPAQVVVSIALSLALAGLCAGGAASIGRGGLWKGSVITLTIFY